MANGEKPTNRNRKKSKRRPGFGKLLAICGVTAAVAIVCALVGYMVIIYNGQQQFEQNKDKLELAEASTIYDINNQEVAVLAREHREIVEAHDIPLKVANAFIATEDRRFAEHAGVDLWAIGRALVKDIVARSVVEGGSTITQQLAKNLFLNSDKTFFRKGTEMSIALALENNMTKEEILTLYLNRIYFGSSAYGIKAAAKVYFGKSDLNELETWEIATLAAIPKAPSTYSPLRNPERSKERRAVVLKLMYDQGYITLEEKEKSQAVEYVPPATSDKNLLTFRDYIINEAEDMYQLEEEKLRRGGYKIYTTMDTNAQKIMEQAFENPKLFQKDGPEQKMQGSMVIVNNKDGGIVAMIGGRDYVNKGLNRALVQRQPGSSFKPLVAYAPAIETGNYNPYSKLKDEHTSYNGYSPRNYDGVYKGEVDMFEAVRKSINAPAVWLLSEIGLKTGKSFAEKMGIPFDAKDNNLAIALGGMTQGVTPLQMAQAYSAFGNNGMMNTAHSIREIVDSDGEKVAVYKPSVKKVMSPKTAYYMTELLRGVVEGGTGTAAKLNRPAAGKTGTTQLDLKGLEKNNRDVWFAGYTPEWSAAVWMGFDKTDAKHYVLPSSGALPAGMFKEVMTKAMAKIPVANFVRPENVPDLKEPPKAVTNLTVEYLPDSRKVKLTWTGDADHAVGTYQVFRKEAEEAEFKLLLEVKEAFEVNDISIKPGEAYQYYVVPHNPQSGQTGDKSNIVDVAVPEEASGSPLPSMSPGTSPDASAKPGESATPSRKPSGSPGSNGSPTPTPSPTTTPTSSATAKPSPTPSNGSGGVKPPANADDPANGAAAGSGKPATSGNGQGKDEGKRQ